MISIQYLITFGFCLIQLGVLSESVEHILDEDNPDIHPGKEKKVTLSADDKTFKCFSREETLPFA
jgi:hypothetical protein